MINLIDNIKKNWKNYLIALFIIIFVFQILGNQHIFNLTNNTAYSSNYIPSYKSSGMERMNSLLVTEQNSITQNNKKIKTGFLYIETSNYDNSLLKLKELIKEENLLLLRENEYKDNKGYRTNNLIIEFNSSDFNKILKQLKNLGDVKNLQITTLDQTKRYNDYSKRILRLQKQMQKYEETLKRTDLKVKDEISIQNRINSLEDQIFSLKDSLSEIDHKVQTSQISLTLKEKKSYVDKVNFITYKQSIDIFLETLNSAIILIIKIVTFILPYLLIYSVYFVMKRLYLLITKKKIIEKKK